MSYFNDTKELIIMKLKISTIISTALLASFFSHDLQASSFWGEPADDESKNKWVLRAEEIKAKHRLIQEQNDAAIARELAKSEQDSGAGPSSSANSEQEALDAEIARALQEDHGAGASTSAAHNPRPQMPGDVLLSYAAYDKDVRTKVTNGMDVHQFNAATNLKARLPVLLGGDTFSDPTMTFAETREALEASVFLGDFEETRRPTLATNLDRLGAYLAGNPVEAGETGANIEEIFSRAWSLARNRPGFARQVFAALCDNTETGGGCYPGHAGRLARLYANFLRSEWQE